MNIPFFAERKKMSQLGLLVAPLLVFIASYASAQSIEMKEDGFRNESEASVVVTNGNSNSQAINIKQQNGYRFDSNTFKGQYRFLRAESGGLESARSWDGSLRYERFFNEALGVYAGQGLESDRYAGFDPRYNSDVGAKYVILKTEELNWIGEAGYRYTDEHRVSSANLVVNHARLYSEFEWAFEKNSAAKIWFEYLPDISENKQNLFNTEISLTTLLRSVFSLKVAYLLKHNEAPAPGTTIDTDTSYTTSLVAKF
jgi:putative salt-induced outer membrane protein